MLSLEKFALLQNLCDNNKEISVDPDSREILKLMGMLYAFNDSLAEFDDAGENYEKISELLSPVFVELDAMLTQHICTLFHKSMGHKVM